VGGEGFEPPTSSV